MAGVDFVELLQISTFLILLYLIGRSCKVLGVSPIIGEMAVGVLLGPNVGKFVPHPEFFELAGIFGVTLMIFESGMHLDFEMLKAVGLRATAVAVLGTFLPIFSGVALIHALDPSAFPISMTQPTAIAVGVTLAPTSVGMALKMLGEAHQLGEKYGQLIVTAAFIDDILSLVALTMLKEIAKVEQTGNALSIGAVIAHGSITERLEPMWRARALTSDLCVVRNTPSCASSGCVVRSGGATVAHLEGRHALQD